MVSAILIMLHLVIPLLITLWIWRTKTNSRLFLGALILLFPLYTYVIGFSMIGFWPMFSVYTPIGLSILYLAAVIVRVRGGVPQNWAPGKNWKEITVFGLTTILLAVLLIPLSTIFQARNFGGEEVVSLSYPFREGVFVVMTGGSNSMVNQHAVSDPQRFAMDIVQLNPFGARATGLSPDELASYRIFDAEIIAPCSGQVLEVRDGLPNRAISDFDLDNAAGNHILIGCDGYTVALAHLNSGSITVQQGQSVELGQLLATVGNSGATIEPHLHIHAVQGHQTSESAFNSSKGVPIEFDGRYLIKNDRISL